MYCSLRLRANERFETNYKLIDSSCYYARVCRVLGYYKVGNVLTNKSKINLGLISVERLMHTQTHTEFILHSFLVFFVF